MAWSNGGNWSGIIFGTEIKNIMVDLFTAYRERRFIVDGTYGFDVTYIDPTTYEDKTVTEIGVYLSDLEDALPLLLGNLPQTPTVTYSTGTNGEAFMDPNDVEHVFEDITDVLTRLSLSSRPIYKGGVDGQAASNQYTWFKTIFNALYIVRSDRGAAYIFPDGDPYLRCITAMYAGILGVPPFPVEGTPNDFYLDGLLFDDFSDYAARPEGWAGGSAHAFYDLTPASGIYDCDLTELQITKHSCGNVPTTSVLTGGLSAWYIGRSVDATYPELGLTGTIDIDVTINGTLRSTQTLEGLEATNYVSIAAIDDDFDLSLEYASEMNITPSWPVSIPYTPPNPTSPGQENIITYLIGRPYRIVYFDCSTGLSKWQA